MRIPLHPACTFLRHHAAGLIAVDKAAGILSHPNAGKDVSGSLIVAPYDFEQEAYIDGKTTWYLLNRLDAPTSGVILLAESAEMAAAVKEAFSAHSVEKTYAAVVKGFPPRREESWKDCLVTRKRRGTLRTEVIRGRPDAICRMELLERAASPPARALLALHPGTGRTHQLRVQCASRRLPILGDATYGDFAFNREFRKRTGEKRLFLHSWKTRLHVKVGGRSIAFAAESPVPEAFSVALG